MRSRWVPRRSRRVLAALFLLVATEAFPCTIFSVSDGTRMLVGNNEDFFYNKDYFLRVVPPRGSSYGRLLFLTKEYIFFEVAQGGMNDQGLFFDGATTPVDPFTAPTPAPEYRRIATNAWGDELLSRCRDVAEAVVYLRQTRFDRPSFHVFLADKGGHSAVVEWVDGKMQLVTTPEQCLVATNHLLTGSTPISPLEQVRDDLVLGHWKRNPQVTLANVASMLVEAMQIGEESGTLYSNVYDLKAGTMTLFLRGRRTQMKTLSLNDLMARGEFLSNVKTLL